jgi:hypothetical protein
MLNKGRPADERREERAMRRREAWAERRKISLSPEAKQQRNYCHGAGIRRSNNNSPSSGSKSKRRSHRVESIPYHRPP